jgi:N-acetylmuramoyl-L-alanine amidase
VKVNRIVVWLILFISVWFTSFRLPPAEFGDGHIKTIIIDPGHGGKDPGALGKTYREKDIALKIGLELRNLIRRYAPDLRVVLTRGDDTFVELHQRGKLAQAYNGDFFVSIHCDASVTKTAFGSSTYILGVNRGQERYRSYIRENQSVLFEENYEQMYDGFDPNSPESYIMFRVMRNVFRQESMYLADKVQKNVETRLQRKNRGVKQGPFIVLWASAMPAILCETGFITNTTDEKFLASETGQVFMASAIYRAIRDYNHELE